MNQIYNEANSFPELYRRAVTQRNANLALDLVHVDYFLDRAIAHALDHPNPSSVLAVDVGMTIIRQEVDELQLPGNRIEHLHRIFSHYFAVANQLLKTARPLDGYKSLVKAAIMRYMINKGMDDETFKTHACRQ